MLQKIPDNLEYYEAVIETAKAAQGERLISRETANVIIVEWWGYDLDESSPARDYDDLYRDVTEIISQIATQKVAEMKSLDLLDLVALKELALWARNQMEKTSQKTEN